MKKTVRYLSTMKKPRVGHSCLVFPIDHPSDLVSNTTYAATSKVVKVHPDGFETINTRYIQNDHTN